MLVDARSCCWMIMVECTMGRRVDYYDRSQFFALHLGSGQFELRRVFEASAYNYSGLNEGLPSTLI